MLRGRTLNRAAVVFVLALSVAPAEADQPIGASCSLVTGDSASGLNGNNAWCNGSTWQYPAYWFGSTTSGCTSSTAGLMQWTGGSVSPNNTMEYCNGSSWTAVNGVATSVPLSGITGATAANSFDSSNYAQTWTWNSLSTQTGLTISTSSALTGGTLVSLQATAASATSTGYLLSISDSTTGTGYGIYSAMTGHGNTGYAGYFTNTDTGSDANYAVYGTAASGSGYGGYFTNTGAGWALNATGTSTFNGKVGIGTTTPVGNLQVGTSSISGSATPAFIDLGGTYSSTAGQNPKLVLYDQGGGQSTGSSFGIGASAGEMDFMMPPGAQYAFFVNGSQKLTLTTTGSVGIGTANPNEALELYTTTTGGLDLELNDAASGGAIWTMIVADNGNSAENGTLNFVYNGGASSQGALAMTQTDSIGISNNGYASIPNTLLDVMGNSDTRIDVGSSDTSSGKYTGFQISSNETGTSAGGVFIPNNNKTIVELWSQVDTLNLTSTGSVGIGTTAPQTSLDVNGAARVGSTAASCTSSNAGAVEYTSGTLEACNGTIWIPIDSGMHFISTQTAASGTTTSLQFTSLPTYNTLFLNCTGMVASSTSAAFTVLIGESTGPTWENTAHYIGYYSIDVGDNSVSAYTGNDLIAGSQSTSTNFSGTTTYPDDVQLYLQTPNSSTSYKMSIWYNEGYTSGSGNYQINNGMSYWSNDKNPVTGLQVTTTGHSGATINSGQCSLYGMN